MLSLGHKLLRESEYFYQEPLRGDGDSFSAESLFDLTFSPFHLCVRVGEIFIRLLCLIAPFSITVSGNMCDIKYLLKDRFVA